jgi:hypothetical protein
VPKRRSPGAAAPDTGQAIVAFVSLEDDAAGSDELATTLREQVAVQIGKLARPAEIVFTPNVPKTQPRSCEGCSRVSPSANQSETPLPWSTRASSRTCRPKFSTDHPNSSSRQAAAPA